MIFKRTAPFRLKTQEIKPEVTPDGHLIYRIDGPPIPLARPRWSNRMQRMYSDQEEDRDRVIEIVAEQHGARPIITTPLHVELHFYMKFPEQRRGNKKWHVSRPDIDNLVKWVLDICVKVGMIKDDSQVCSLSARKIYDMETRTEFILRELP